MAVPPHHFYAAAPYGPAAPYYPGGHYYYPPGVPASGPYPGPAGEYAAGSSQGYHHVPMISPQRGTTHPAFSGRGPQSYYYDHAYQQGYYPGYYPPPPGHAQYLDYNG